MNTFVHLWQYNTEFFLECEMFQTKVIEENQNTLYVQQHFPENRALFEIMWKNMV
jgi:hypothetical protein